MNIQPRAKHLLFASVTLLCLISSAYLYSLNIISFYISIVAACVTILAPLASALYIYRGKPAKWFAILATIGMLFGLIYAVDLVATLQSFKTICSSRGAGHEFINTSGDVYACTADSEGDYLTVYNRSVSRSDFVFYPYLLVILVSIGNLLYLPVRLLRMRFRRV